MRIAYIGGSEDDIAAGGFFSDFCPKSKYCYIWQKFLTYCAICIRFLGLTAHKQQFKK
jgi:hypothetical protein